LPFTFMEIAGIQTSSHTIPSKVIPSPSYGNFFLRVHHIQLRFALGQVSHAQ
jgi:hypothetical protein